MVTVPLPCSVHESDQVLTTSLGEATAACDHLELDTFCTSPALLS